MSASTKPSTTGSQGLRSSWGGVETTTGQSWRTTGNDSDDILVSCGATGLLHPHQSFPVTSRRGNPNGEVTDRTSTLGQHQRARIRTSRYFVISGFLTVLLLTGCGQRESHSPAPKPSWATAPSIHPDFGDPVGHQRVNDQAGDVTVPAVDIRSATLRRGVDGELDLTVRTSSRIHGELIFQLWYWVTPNRGDLIDVRTGGGMPPRIVTNSGGPSPATHARIDGRSIRLHLAYRDTPFRNSVESFRWRVWAATRGVFPEILDKVRYHRFG